MPLRGANVKHAASIGVAIACGADTGRLVSSVHVRGAGKAHFILGPYVIAVGLSVLVIEGVMSRESSMPQL